MTSKNVKAKVKSTRTYSQIFKDILDHFEYDVADDPFCCAVDVLNTPEAIIEGDYNFRTAEYTNGRDFIKEWYNKGPRMTKKQAEAIADKLYRSKTGLATFVTVGKKDNVAINTFLECASSKTQRLQKVTTFKSNHAGHYPLHFWMARNDVK